MHCYYIDFITFRRLLWIWIMCRTVILCTAKEQKEENVNSKNMISDCDCIQCDGDVCGRHTQDSTDGKAGGEREFLRGNNTMAVKHTDVAATLATLTAYLDTMRKIRQRQGTRPYTGANDLLEELLFVSSANLRLLLDTRHIVPDTSYKDLASKFVEDPDVQRVPAGRRSLEHGCGGSSALGIFNFLTFVVYAFSLLATLVSLATGSMANSLSGTFLPSLFHLLGHRGRRKKRALRGVWKELLARLHPRKHPAFFTGFARQSQENLNMSVEQAMGSGLMTALLQLSGGPSHALACPAPLISLTHNYFIQKGITHLNISL
ncbi:uncharacterized protein [Panulirus ornatus]|uniref:uncharacterized protein isoform X2 n=1 Tax=Panulirus ornatus TaxID=150431 RepID=UPI003A860905